MTFLEEIAERVLAHEAADACWVILPSNRAVSRFQKICARLSPDGTWLPRAQTLSRHLLELAGADGLDSLESLAHLHKAYEKVTGKTVELAPFLGWAKVAIHDFNAIDHHMLDANQVFKNLVEYAELEAWSFQPGEELTEGQRRYLEQWMNLAPLYHAFHSKLEKEGLMTSGRIAGKAAKSATLPDCSHVFIAGLGGFTPAEKAYVERLRRARMLTLVWDADADYVEDTEAGSFIRKFASPSERKALPCSLSSHPPQIDFIGVSSTSMAGTYLHETLKSLPEKEWHTTAVVLPQGGTLGMVMQCLPDGVPANVTMGLAWRETEVGPWWELLRRMTRRKGSGWHYEELASWFCHPTTQELLDGDFVGEWEGLARWFSKRKWTWVSSAELMNPAPAGEIVAGKSHVAGEHPWPRIAEMIGQLGQMRTESVDDLLESLCQWSGAMSSGFGGEAKQEGEENAGRRKNPWIQSAWKRWTAALGTIMRFQEQFSCCRSVADVDILFRHLLSSELIDLLGEPDEGVQIMGLLESRALDFDRVIVFDCNEGVLPKSGMSDSYIPADLAGALGLPSQHDREAKYAYYLYRLLHRSSQVDLLHLTGANDLGPSRYLLQLQARYGEVKAIGMRNYQSMLPTKPPEILPVKWTPEASERLKEWGAHGISPSALNQFKNCPRGFFYRYIMRFSEPDQIEDAMSASQLGNVVHAALEEGLENLRFRPLTSADFDDLLQSIDALLANGIAREYRAEATKFGENFLSKRIALTMLKELLRQERREIERGVERVIIGLEGKMQAEFSLPNEGGNVVLKGTVDRLEIENGRLQVVDYKSGKVEGKELRAAQPFEETLSSGKLDKALQLLVYAAIALAASPAELSAAAIDANAEPLEPPRVPGATAGIRSAKRARSGLIPFALDKEKVVTGDSVDVLLEWLALRFNRIHKEQPDWEHDSESIYCPFCVDLNPPSKVNF